MKSRFHYPDPWQGVKWLPAPSPFHAAMSAVLGLTKMVLAVAAVGAALTTVIGCLAQAGV
ncbi:MAG: hypothetical protein DI552_00260 [Brevundimonas sp.]|uniref:hypothetical protein n=1 Tax=Brevundimonas sp. TaxID=1871086 RepID=UPI000DBC3DC6|nr:hypothetical protein [Brevundimonas sp.]PZU62337.1 MAG: hypothetical protein DI552_00260 [Brevundimonas sp.]